MYYPDSAVHTLSNTQTDNGWRWYADRAQCSILLGADVNILKICEKNYLLNIALGKQVFNKKMIQ